MRTRIYLTECQRDELAVIANERGKRQSDVIREAIDRFIEHWGRQRRERIVRETAGTWSDRAAVPDYDSIRASWERG